MTLQTQTGEAAAALQCQLEGAEASHSLHAKLAPVPDLDNRRFCRACATTLPVGAFPPGKRRYLCRRHVWLRVKKPSKERALADPLRRLRWVLWRCCLDDAKTVFGHRRVALRQRDVAGVLSGLDPGECFKRFKNFKGGDSPEHADPESDNVKGAAAPAVTLLPAQLLSRENFVLVDTDARRDMLRAYREGGVDRYWEALATLG